MHNPVAAIITVAAVALGVLHAAFPSIQIDAVTIGFFVLATLPWLLPFLKSAKIPGVGEFEFRDFKQQIKEQLDHGVQRVERVADRVEKVIEQFAISGATPDTAQTLTVALNGYHAYLEELGFDVHDKPKVEVTSGSDVIAYYDGERKAILVAREYVADLDVIYREYGNHVLISMMSDGRDGDPYAALTPEQQPVESGLADYYLCSYKNDPVVGRKVATIGRGFRQPFIRDLTIRTQLSREEAYKPVEPIRVQQVGEIWGAAFWEIRGLVGGAITDSLLLTAWRNSKTKPFLSSLVRAIQDSLNDDHIENATKILKQRGVPLPNE